MNESARPSVTRPSFTRALREFLATEVAGGAVLLIAAVVAIVWANSPWSASYVALWHTKASVAIGNWSLSLDLQHWVNDGLMAVFFLVVGLEVKRELLQGELNDRRRAMLPIAAALGGMVVPAAVYAIVNAGDPGVEGWGIPMATDIAFAIGVLALVAPRAPSSLRVFLLALAIVDDIGAIIVIAVFYSKSLAPAWLAAALAIVVLVYALRSRSSTLTPLFVALGAALWFCLHEAGVHATLAGVVMGLLAPAAPRLDREIALSRGDELLDVFTPEAARETLRIAKLSVSELEWLLHGLHPVSSLIVVPIFALANAGVSLSADQLDSALTSKVTLGIILGLVAGKLVGITGAAWLAHRSGLAQLPPDTRWAQIAGVAALGGIGFTVSLFITDLAFESSALVDEAKVGILAASVAASALGAVLLRSRRRTQVT